MWGGGGGEGVKGLGLYSLNDFFLLLFPLKLALRSSRSKYNASPTIAFLSLHTVTYSTLYTYIQSFFLKTC